MFRPIRLQVIASNLGTPKPRILHYLYEAMPIQSSQADSRLPIATCSIDWIAYIFIDGFDYFQKYIHIYTVLNAH